MGRSPLDTAFGSASTQEKRSKKGIAYVALLGVAGLASASSVFAANVNINGGGTDPILYSQGTTTIAACDDDIDAALGAAYVAAEEEFVLDTIELTGVSDECDGLDITIDLYEGTTKMVTITGAVKADDSTTILVGQAGIALADANDTAGSAVTDLQGTVTTTYLNSKTAALLASNADRIVIEIN